MQIEPIRQKRLYRQVADQLRHLIDNGHFAIGARLPTERELALQLGISRPTVREALIALEVDGLVDIRVGSGMYVLASQPQGVNENQAETTPLAGPFEILNARALFEGAVAEEAAKLATGADIAAIDLALDAMAKAHHPGPQSMDLDRAFHIAVADVLHNDAISQTVGGLFDQRINPYFAQLASYFENAGSWQEAHHEHRLIRDCIAAKDPLAARQSMCQHLQNSQKRFSESFGEKAQPKVIGRVSHPSATSGGQNQETNKAGTNRRAK